MARQTHRGVLVETATFERQTLTLKRDGEGSKVTFTKLTCKPAKRVNTHLILHMEDYDTI